MQSDEVQKFAAKTYNRSRSWYVTVPIRTAEKMDLKHGDTVILTIQKLE